MSSNSFEMDSSLESRIQSLTLKAENECEQLSFNKPLVSSDCYYSIQNAHPDVLQQLQYERLKVVMEQLERERLDTQFSRTCLFCKKHFVGNRRSLMEHLKEQHHFVIGNENNVVFINELLDVLEHMLKELKCFYCEKTFKDWMTLKEHMRKKQHKIINPNNKDFDKFYLINYLEPGKRWDDIQKEDDTFLQDDDDIEMDLGDEDQKSECVCLFCNNKLEDFENTLLHMKNDHQFDFKGAVLLHNLKFYSQVKLINFIRRKVFEKQCLICDLQFNYQDDLIKHMTESGHIAVVPDQSKWDQSMYYFPTFENDNLLCCLEVDEDSEDEGKNMVYAENSTLPSTVLQHNSTCSSGEPFYTISELIAE